MLASSKTEEFLEKFQMAARARRRQQGLPQRRPLLNAIEDHAALAPPHHPPSLPPAPLPPPLGMSAQTRMSTQMSYWSSSLVISLRCLNPIPWKAVSCACIYVEINIDTLTFLTLVPCLSLINIWLFLEQSQINLRPSQKPPFGCERC